MPGKKKTSANIGHNLDGTYFCGECGKSGFKSLPAARGHLSVCEGPKAIADLLFHSAGGDAGGIGARGAPGAEDEGGRGARTDDIQPENVLKSSKSSLDLTDLKKYFESEMNQFRVGMNKIDSRVSSLSKAAFNHMEHVRPKNHAMGGDFRHTQSVATHPLMRHDPMTFGFSGMPEALGFTPRLWAVAKIVGVSLLAYFAYRILSEDENLARLVKKRLVRKI